ncbi:MAG TPA: MBOAT family O-acyltransferase [Alphaproteobacteria bacterium]|nr:MBOAT family O-acyltransferase [Alphaproteobacteria bacterium]
MIFSSAPFIFIFLPACAIAYVISRKISVRLPPYVLIAFSILFYAAWNFEYCLLLLALTAFNWKLGNALALRKSRAVLALGVAINLLNLGLFKYSLFAAEIVRDATGAFLPILALVLPLGISFFTFQKIAYLTDCYRGEVGRLRLREFILFVFFFPQLIAGPIVRAREMIPQLRRLEGKSAGFLAGLALFSAGLAKKAVIADRVALLVDPVFAAIAGGVPVTPLDAWSAVLAYAFQIYFDFSGYSDMAIGLGRMFGVELPVNFASPYQARSMIEFWRRWHITLSRFLRDYLYIPLGGSRRGATIRYRNIMIVMLLGGLWHGAGWAFVCWGGLHGIYLVINHLWRGCRAQTLALRHLGEGLYSFLAWLLTFAAVTVAWVFFRASSLSSARLVLSSMAGWGTAPSQLTNLNGGQAVWLALLLVVVTALPNSNALFRRELAEPSALLPPGLVQRLSWRPTMAWVLLSGLMFMTGVLFMASDSRFLYFQF